MYLAHSNPMSRLLTGALKILKPVHSGEVSERFKEHAWKACVGEILPWVQIPPSPPVFAHKCFRIAPELRSGRKRRRAFRDTFGGIPRRDRTGRLGWFPWRWASAIC